MAGRDASAGILADGYRAADQFHADVIDGAHEKLKASSRNLADLAERDRMHGDASDARAYLYAEAEQRHHDGLAALALHFGSGIAGPATRPPITRKPLVASIDLAGDPKSCHAIARWPMPVAAVEFRGSRQERRVDASGRVVPERRGPTPSAPLSPAMLRRSAGSNALAPDAHRAGRVDLGGGTDR